MAIHSTITHLKDLLHKITQDISKAENGNKAASQRVRTNTVRLEKTAKQYRKESISTEKLTKDKKPKKAAPKAGAKSKAKLKAKPKAKAALARPRALAFKKPTAKLPIRRAGFSR